MFLCDVIMIPSGTAYMRLQYTGLLSVLQLIKAAVVNYDK